MPFIQDSKDYCIFSNSLLSNIKTFYYENSMCNRIENSSKLKLWSVQKKKLVILFFHEASFCKFRNEQISECENSKNYVLNLPVILVETCKNWLNGRQVFQQIFSEKRLCDIKCLKDIRELQLEQSTEFRGKQHMNRLRDVYLFREYVKTGAAGARTHRSLDIIFNTRRIATKILGFKKKYLKTFWRHK